MNKNPLLSALLIFLASAPKLAATTWDIQTIDTGEGMANSISLDLNAAGLPAMAYNAGKSSVLRIATSNGTQWTVETAADGGQGASFKFSPAGALSASHVAGTSYTQQSGRLCFATKNKKTWSNTVVERSDVYLRQTSLVYNPAGEPCIAYYKTGNSSGLWFARRSGTRWITQMVASGAGAAYNQMAIDSAGNTLIVYSDDEDHSGYLDSLKIAISTGGGWNISTITNTAGLFPSLAINRATGYPAVTCLLANGNGWYYFEWSGAAWLGTEIPVSANNLSLDFDDYGNAVIAYNLSTQDVRIARRDFASGTLTIETVGPSGFIGFSAISVKVGLDGRAIIAHRYYASPTGPDTVRVATQISP